MSESIHDSIEPMHSEAIPQPDSMEDLGSLLKGLLDVQGLGRVSEAQQAVAAWFGANGDRERAHTTRVFLKPPRRGADRPVLCVYVDSHSYVTDLNANRDLYLARLANWGYLVSGIEFAVDRDTRKATDGGARPAASTEQIERPLTSEEQAHVEELLANVPAALKESISKAIIASIRAQGKI